jgi:nucleotide-binding universal stress UspA family protein
VLVGVDGSAHALAATRWAAAEAASRGTGLVLVHAAAYLHDEPVDAVERRARGLLARARTEAVQYLAESDIHVELVAAEPRECLVALSEDAALLVLGLTGGGSVDELLLGSTTLAISEHARCPLAGVRTWPMSPVSGHHDTVVLGVRHVGADLDAITLAFDLADRGGGDLLVIHCRYPDPHPLGRDRRRETNRERIYLAWQLRAWRHRHPGVSVSYHLGDGHPSQELLRHADRARAVVVGSRKRSPAARALIGSTGRSVLRYSQVPTIVVGPSARLGSLAPTALHAENDPHAPGNLW